MGVSGQRLAPAVLYPPGKDPGTHCTGGWVGPRAGLDTEATGKIPCPCRGSNLDHPVVQLTELTRLPYAYHTAMKTINLVFRIISDTVVVFTRWRQLP
jgi:hypothetical protein